MKLRDKALAIFEHAIVKVVGFFYLELAMTDVDREAIRHMEKLYGRRLTHHEKSGVLAYRIGSELGKSVEVRSGKRKHCGLGTTTNGFCEAGGDACACTCDCAVCIPGDVTNMISIIIAFVVGNVFGAVSLIRWYLHRIKNPEVAREMLAILYAKAHKHPLSVGEFDPTGVCPVCGYVMRGMINEDHMIRLIDDLTESYQKHLAAGLGLHCGRGKWQGGSCSGLHEGCECDCVVCVAPVEPVD